MSYEQIKAEAKQMDKFLSIFDANKPAEEILGGYTKEDWARWYGHTSNRDRVIAREITEKFNEEIDEKGEPDWAAEPEQ